MIKIEPYRARRTRVDTYELTWPRTDGQLQIAVTDSPLGVLNGELVFETRLDAAPGRAEITLPRTTGSLFFRLRTPAGDEHIFTDRAIPTKGVRNFRDFGGYLAADGRRVRWRTLFRSGHLGSLTEEDKQRIASLGITLVCDFRTRREVEHNPSSFAQDHTPRIEQLYLDPGDHSELAKIMAGGKESREQRNAAHREMQEINRLLATSRAGIYRRMFETLLDNDGPSLIHCTAGKDRTGFGAAIILAALGVPEDTIFHDYLLTNEYTDANLSLAWYSKYAGVKLDKDAAAPLFTVHSDYLQSAFDVIRSDYGSMDAYLRDEMGLDDQTLNALRARYLES